MARRLPTTHLDDAIQLYESSDLGYRVVAQRFGVSWRVLRDALIERGTLRSGAEGTRLARARGERTRRAEADIDEIARLYLSGVSEAEIARTVDFTRERVKNILVRAGIERRSVAKANRLMMTQRSPEENRRNTAAAHAAVRGAPMTFDEKCRRAQLRHGKVPFNAYELLYAAWLRLRGLNPVHQHAVGPYNCDLACGTVAVEIFGGNWHGTGKHAATFVERSNYILDQGWTLVVVWVNQGTKRLGEGSADYIAALVEQASSDPSLRGQYRVIWGDGQEVPTEGRELHEFATVPSRRRAPHGG